MRFSVAVITLSGFWVCASALLDVHIDSDFNPSSNTSISAYLTHLPRVGCPDFNSQRTFTKMKLGKVLGIFGNVVSKIKSTIKWSFSQIKKFFSHLFPKHVRVQCLARLFKDSRSWYRFVTLLQEIVRPCSKRVPTTVECEEEFTFKNPGGEAVEDWRCFLEAKKSEEFLNKLEKMYVLLHPCSGLSKSNKVLRERRIHNIYYASWKFWWYFFSGHVVFKLARTDKEPVECTIYDSGMLFDGNINSTIPTKILISGHVDYEGSSFTTEMVNAYLKLEEPYNVVFVHWTSTPNEPYFLTKHRLIYVARSTATLILRLINDYGVELEDIHIVGHSLGAHVAGMTGDMINDEFGSSQPLLGRVTGLDPTLPLFKKPQSKWRISPSSAKMVDVIHTCSNALGIPYRAGTVDFFVNGKSPVQPGCGSENSSTEDTDSDQMCAHYRAVDLYVESISYRYHFPALQCHSATELGDNHCDGNDVVFMGEGLSLNARGIYYVKTAGKSPFGFGTKEITTTKKPRVKDVSDYDEEYYEYYHDEE